MQTKKKRRDYHLRIDLAQMPLQGNVACNFKKIPTLTQDLSRRCIATRGGEHLHTLEDHKVEAFINAVDVVVHLNDPSRSITECTTPPCSTHVQLDDVLAFSMQQERQCSR